MGLKVGHSDAVHWNAFGFYAYMWIQIYLNKRIFSFRYIWIGNMHGKKMANSNGDDWSKGGWTGQGSWPWLLPLPPFYDRLCFLDVEGDDDDAVHKLEHLSYYLSWTWRWWWWCWWWWTGQGHPHLPRARDLNTVTHSALHFSVMGSAGGKSYVLCKTIIFFSSLLSLYSELQYTFA